MPPRTRKAPQDHKPRTRAKAIAAEAGPKLFEFTHDGETHTLPPASNYAHAVTGGVFMDALLDGAEEANIKLTLMLVRAAKDDLTPDAYEALRAKPVTEFMEIVADWMQEGGVNLGESQRSSS